MTMHQLLVHDRGPALWREHKPLDEILMLRETTPEQVWSATYQGVPTPPGGYIFKRAWWRGQHRYDIHDAGLIDQCYARYISWDTAMKDKDSSDYSAYVVGDLLADYRLLIRYGYQKKLEFPDLPAEIEAVAQRWNWDGKLRAVIVEDKASGTSAIQTLWATADATIAHLITPFIPTTDKVTRAKQASVWCKNGSVLLPALDPDLIWLADFEDRLFTFPEIIDKDIVDAFDQLVLYCEGTLEYGYRARQGDMVTS